MVAVADVCGGAEHGARHAWPWRGGARAERGDAESAERWHHHGDGYRDGIRERRAVIRQLWKQQQHPIHTDVGYLDFGHGQHLPGASQHKHVQCEESRVRLQQHDHGTGDFGKLRQR